MGRLERVSIEDHWRQVKELRDGLKKDWNELWKTKRDDEIRAEDISTKDYYRLFVERGEIISATRDFKPVSFTDILERHLTPELARRVDPDPEHGGYRKFARAHFLKKPVKRERPRIEADLDQQQRKGGAGWLNKIRVLRKTRESR